MQRSWFYSKLAPYNKYTYTTIIGVIDIDNWNSWIEFAQLEWPIEKAGHNREEGSPSLTEPPADCLLLSRFQQTIKILFWEIFFINMFPPTLTSQHNQSSALYYQWVHCPHCRLILLGMSNPFHHKQWKIRQQSSLSKCRQYCHQILRLYSLQKARSGLDFNQKAACLSASWTQWRHAMPSTLIPSVVWDFTGRLAQGDLSLI